MTDAATNSRQTRKKNANRDKTLILEHEIGFLDTVGFSNLETSPIWNKIELQEEKIAEEKESSKKASLQRKKSIPLLDDEMQNIKVKAGENFYSSLLILF